MVVVNISFLYYLGLLKDCTQENNLQRFPAILPWILGVVSREESYIMKCFRLGIVRFHSIPLEMYKGNPQFVIHETVLVHQCSYKSFDAYS